MKKHSRYKSARNVLIFWCIFIGVGALLGATCMLIAPDGRILSMQAMLPFFQALPFADKLFMNYTFPGIALLCVNGIPNLVAAGLLIGKKRSGIVCGGVFGVTLMAWIIIQFVIFPPNFLSTTYFIFGAAQAATGMAAWIFYEQEQFRVNIEDYKNIGKDGKKLVVYFSRMGYTKKVALEEADRTGAELFEVTVKEPIEGTLGFWWCGRFGMHRWAMPIEPIAVDLTKYEHVTVCSPIWVFRICSPIRAFCKEAKGKIKEADYIITHFNRCAYLKAEKEMNDLLGLQATSTQNVCVRRGRTVARKENKNERK